MEFDVPKLIMCSFTIDVRPQGTKKGLNPLEWFLPQHNQRKDIQSL